MTIDEAIKHCEEVADGMTEQGKCEECAAEHRQLAEWLKELKQLKEQELCEDAISRQAVINAIANTCFWLSADNWEELTKCIDSISPVTPQPKMGHWIMHIDDLFPAESTMECNKCREHQPITIDDNYCPNCGQKMAKEVRK